jgi:hypothetical protein
MKKINLKKENNLIKAVKMLPDGFFYTVLCCPVLNLFGFNDISNSFLIIFVAGTLYFYFALFFRGKE